MGYSRRTSPRVVIQSLLRATKFCHIDYLSGFPDLYVFPVNKPQYWKPEILKSHSSTTIDFILAFKQPHYLLLKLFSGNTTSE